MSNTLIKPATSPESHILEQYETFVNKGILNTNFSTLNELAIKRFEQLKFPHRKHEMYTFVDTEELVSTHFDRQQSLLEEVLTKLDVIKSHIYAGCEESVIVIVNGEYNEKLSNTTKLGESVIIRRLEQSLSDSKVKQYLLDSLKQEEDVFSLLNSAFLTDGLMIQVKANSKVDKPLQILHVSTGSENHPVTTTPRVFIDIERLSEIKMIVKYVGLKGNYFVNSVQDFLIQEGASVSYSQIQADPQNCWHFSKTSITLSKDSYFKATNVSLGSRLVRHHYDAHLKEEGGKLVLNGISVLVDQEQVHQYIRLHHEAPRCVSREQFKNIIKDQGHSSVDATVIVHEGAQQTDSDQLIHNLMLSDDGKADTKPNLMIYADDVKCTHGATVGQVNDDQLFYLRSRGLSEKEARSLLTSSFAQSIVQLIEHPAVVEEISKTLLQKLEGD